MTELIIGDDVYADLQRISAQEKRPVEEILRSMIQQYTVTPNAATGLEPLDAYIGMFDEDVTDLSTLACKPID